MNKIEQCILDSIPYEIIFCDTDHIVRYENKFARDMHDDPENGKTLVGKSLLDCHNEHSKQMIISMLERLKNGEDNIFYGVGGTSRDNLYFNGVYDENGELIGYFERHEKSNPEIK